MKFFLLLLAAVLNFSAADCGAQSSKLPRELPGTVEIRFNENAGMIYAFTKIEISNQTLTVEEKLPNEKTPRKWSAQLEKAELENLYKLFVDNRFDTIRNEERKEIVYDAGSESVSITAGAGAFFSVSSGPNSPLSPDSQRRYQTIANAIRELRERSENKPRDPADPNFAIIVYDRERHYWQVKNAQKTVISYDEIARVKEILADAVGNHNSKLKDKNFAIEPENYKFQLLPFIDRSGAKKVWVNGFCGEPRTDWRTEIVAVDDGGKCYFNFYVNLTKNIHEDFSVNGEA